MTGNFAREQFARRGDDDDGVLHEVVVGVSEDDASPSDSCVGGFHRKRMHSSWTCSSTINQSQRLVPTRFLCTVGGGSEGYAGFWS